MKSRIIKTLSVLFFCLFFALASIETVDAASGRSYGGRNTSRSSSSRSSSSSSNRQEPRQNTRTTTQNRRESTSTQNRRTTTQNRRTNAHNRRTTTARRGYYRPRAGYRYYRPAQSRPYYAARWRYPYGQYQYRSYGGTRYRYHIIPRSYEGYTYDGNMQYAVLLRHTESGEQQVFVVNATSEDQAADNALRFGYSTWGGGNFQVEWVRNAEG